MKTTKIFFMAALALMTVACSNDDTNILTPAEQPAKAEGIPFTATISMGESASTRALAEDNVNNKIVATWETGEKVALIYMVGSTPTKTDAEVTKQADGTATISATLASGATNGSDVTIIYPSTAADGTTGNVLANLLAAQDGTLATIATNYEVRKGTGKLSINAGGATVNNGTAGTPVSLAAQNAIFKFTIQDLSAADKDASKFFVSDDEGNVITIVTPGSATDELYVALPVMTAGTYWFNATIGEKPYIAKATTAADTEVGKYYQTTVKMATIGDVILSNGTFAVKGTDTEQAVIANIGCLPLYFDRFIAIALTDVGKILWSSVASNVATYAADHAITICGMTYNTNAIGDNCYDKTNSKCETTTAPTGLVKGWRVPSVTDWNYVFYGISSITSSSGTRTRTWLPISAPVEYIGGSTTPPEPSAYRTAINTACNNGELQPEDYWSSSESRNANVNMAIYGFYDNSDYRQGFGYMGKDYMYGARVRTVFAY